MYLQLYDYDNNNASVQLTLGTCQEYDIPESGSYTDSHEDGPLQPIHYMVSIKSQHLDCLHDQSCLILEISLQHCMS